MLLDLQRRVRHPRAGMALCGQLRAVFCNSLTGESLIEDASKLEVLRMEKEQGPQLGKASLLLVLCRAF